MRKPELLAKRLQSRKYSTMMHIVIAKFEFAVSTFFFFFSKETKAGAYLCGSSGFPSRVTAACLKVV